jgi:hypothetical protein
MKRFIAPLAVIVLAGIAPLAQANIQITYKVDGFAPVVCFDVSDVVNCANDVGSVTGLKITGLGANSNLTGDPTLALASSANSILTSVDNKVHHIEIDVVAQGFIMPVAPPLLEFDSQIGTTAPVLRAGNSLTFLSCVDQTDSLGICPATYNQVLLTPNVATLKSDNKTAPTMLISPLAAPYSIAEQLDINVGAGGRINFSGSTTLVPVPEPMSIALLGGVVLLTSRLIRRKQNQAS